MAPEKTCGPPTTMSFAGIELDSILLEARLPLEKVEKCKSKLHSPKLNLFTDASGAIGFGPIFGPHWCYGKWPINWEHLNIAILEFYPIVLSLYLWGAAMSNQCILFFTDNESLVHVINKQSCKDKTLMVFVWQLVSICLNHNIVFKAKHIPGIHNNLADALSRLQVQTFRQLAPVHMDPFPTEIPLHLQPQSWVL